MNVPEVKNARLSRTVWFNALTLFAAGIPAVVAPLDELFTAQQMAGVVALTALVNLILRVIPMLEDQNHEG